MEPGLNDRLQPALLDRLTDDARTINVVRVTPDPERLAALGLALLDVERVLHDKGFVRTAPATDGLTTLDLPVTGSLPRLDELRALPLAAPGCDPASTVLQQCCRVEIVTVLNVATDSPERFTVSARRLRAAVLRDLAWLLNASPLEDVADLSGFPQVRRSVLNYGVRSQAGRPLGSIEPPVLAEQIRESISCFEPRLSDVRVTPEVRDASPAEGNTLSFLVEAELWGNPLPQHLWMRTSIDVDTGNAQVTESKTGT